MGHADGQKRARDVAEARRLVTPSLGNYGWRVFSSSNSTGVRRLSTARERPRVCEAGSSLREPGKPPCLPRRGLCEASNPGRYAGGSQRVAARAGRDAGESRRDPTTRTRVRSEPVGQGSTRPLLPRPPLRHEQHRPALEFDGPRHGLHCAREVTRVRVLRRHSEARRTARRPDREGSRCAGLRERAVHTEPCAVHGAWKRAPVSQSMTLRAHARRRLASVGGRIGAEGFHRRRGSREPTRRR